MLIEQIIELQLREPGPPGLTCSYISYFHDKTKIFKENLRVGFSFTAKMLYETIHLTSPYLDQITYQLNFNTKMQDVKRILDLNCNYRKRIKQFNFFNWLSNVKNLVFLNGSTLNMCEM